jgi:hypothetical protein
VFKQPGPLLTQGVRAMGTFGSKLEPDPGSANYPFSRSAEKTPQPMMLTQVFEHP